MCVRIIKTREEVAYDSSIPLEDQIKGSRQIIVDYEPNDASVEKFVKEIERLCLYGISATLNIKVKHNNHVMGAKVLKKVNETVNGLEINEIIKLISTMHAESDRKLEEIANYCIGKECDVKQTT